MLTSQISWEIAPSDLETKIARAEVEFWRSTWFSIDPTVRAFLENTGTLCRAQTRMGQNVIGPAQEFKFSLSRLSIVTETHEWDSKDGKRYREFKTVDVNESNIAGFEWIHEREEIIDEPTADDGASADSLTDLNL